MKEVWKFDEGVVRAKRNAKKKVAQKLFFFFFFFFFFGKNETIFCAALRSPGACNAAGHHAGLPDWMLRVLKWPKIAKKCQKEGYIVINTDSGPETEIS